MSCPCIRITAVKKLKITFLAAVILVSVVDLLAAYVQAIVQFNDHTSVPLHSLANQFKGLDELFKDVPVAGYYTDKDMENPVAIAQYEQAQYVVAPTVLALNHTEYHWVLVVCSGPQTAMKVIKEHGLVPLKINQGIILAVNPQGIN